MYLAIKNYFEAIKTSRPLVLNITNLVSMELVANGLLSLGASPIMSQSLEEAHDLVALSAVVVVNMGTLNTDFIKLAEAVISYANQLDKPVVLDPVGVGASQYRTCTVVSWLERFKFTALCGNASEIIALTQITHGLTKGVDTAHSTQQALEVGKNLSNRYAVKVIISGAEDAIIYKSYLQSFNRGSRLMPYISGSGCLLTAVIAAFIAIEDSIEACSAAVLFYTVAAETAAAKAIGPGTFKTAFLDALTYLSYQKSYE